MPVATILRALSSVDIPSSPNRLRTIPYCIVPHFYARSQRGRRRVARVVTANYHGPGCRVSEPKFIVDVNAGRLAKWLRIMGYDAASAPDLEDTSLVSLAREEGRILITRNRKIMMRRSIASGEVQALLLESDRLEEQLREVVEACKLDTKRALSRCLVCNGAAE